VDSLFLSKEKYTRVSGGLNIGLKANVKTVTWQELSISCPSSMGGNR
jgi:hypothetical protein